MESSRRSDPVFYPAEDRMPDARTHQVTRLQLCDVVARHLRQRGVRAFVSSDQFVYWVQGDNRVSIAPDLYVVLGAEPDLLPDVWKTWEGGVPDLVIEVVSARRRKDYDDAPLRYDEMGVEEAFVFDPHEKRTRVRWQHFRRLDGRLVCVERTDGDRVWSSVLEAWLVTAHHGDGTPTVRVATGPNAEHLVPTTAEAWAAEVALKDEELAREREERAKKDAQIEALRRELARRRREA